MPKKLPTPRKPSSSSDAIALLKADHKQVTTWFKQFESARSDNNRQSLAQKICSALRVHTKIEEEIFYPAFIEATGEVNTHHEAIIEHDGAKRLIAQIEASDPSDEYYRSKVHVLSEMIKHHVREEERPGGMFAKSRRAKSMDLKALGSSLRARKAELTSSSS